MPRNREGNSTDADSEFEKMTKALKAAGKPSIKIKKASELLSGDLGRRYDSMEQGSEANSLGMAAMMRNFNKGKQQIQNAGGTVSLVDARQQEIIDAAGKMGLVDLDLRQDAEVLEQSAELIMAGNYGQVKKGVIEALDEEGRGVLVNSVTRQMVANSFNNAMQSTLGQPEPVPLADFMNAFEVCHGHVNEALSSENLKSESTSGRAGYATSMRNVNKIESIESGIEEAKGLSMEAVAGYLKRQFGEAAAQLGAQVGDLENMAALVEEFESAVNQGVASPSSSGYGSGSPSPEAVSVAGSPTAQEQPIMSRREQGLPPPAYVPAPTEEEFGKPVLGSATAKLAQQRDAAAKGQGDTGRK